MAISVSKYQAQPIFWKQIFSLAALEATITIGWLAYEKYQPVLLQKFHFVELAAFLIVAQGVLGMIFHPVSGRMADKMIAKKGSKFPVIISGIAFAAVIFVAVSLAILTNPESNIRWILPVLVILWLAAMSTFHSPAISLLESFAPVEKFPRIAAILSIVFGVIYTIEPFIITILDTVGLTATFILGGLLLVVAGLAMKSITLGDDKYQSHIENRNAQIQSETSSMTIFSVGFLVGLFKSTIFFAIPVIVGTKLNINNNDYIQSAILLVSAVVSLPISFLVEKLGAEKSLIIGCIIALIVSVATIYLDLQWVQYASIVLSGSIFGFLSISALPFVLKRVKSSKSGLGIGLYYGGVAGATAIINILLLT